MLEIVISVTLYVGALVLLVKGAFAFCNHSEQLSVRYENVQRSRTPGLYSGDDIELS